MYISISIYIPVRTYMCTIIRMCRQSLYASRAVLQHSSSCAVFAHASRSYNRLLEQTYVPAAFYMLRVLG